MKNFVRIACIVLSLVLFVGILSSCGVHDIADQVSVKVDLMGLKTMDSLYIVKRAILEKNPNAESMVNTSETTETSSGETETKGDSSTPELEMSITEYRNYVGKLYNTVKDNDRRKAISRVVDNLKTIEKCKDEATKELCFDMLFLDYADFNAPAALADEKYIYEQKNLENGNKDTSEFVEIKNTSRIEDMVKFVAERVLNLKQADSRQAVRDIVMERASFNKTSEVETPTETDTVVEPETDTEVPEQPSETDTVAVDESDTVIEPETDTEPEVQTQEETPTETSEPETATDPESASAEE